ncbi:protein NRT1/ PTR FAMILY 5.6-like [Hevea brasiliensis]|uniref:protein NRT1/ PTR FAMILY 5.6-like n=1 Tax=Hevea brasiliensis TaxID=3981 RepID=UPI0025FB6F76|nr:protein NRT1/ PTR FAMILY 5.6-like [Hevea brasiliensis]
MSPMIWGLVLLIFAPQTGLLAVFLITVGIAGAGRTLKAFLADHVIEPTEENTSIVVDDGQVTVHTNSWWVVAFFMGAAISLTSSSLFHYQYKTAFIVSATLMGVTSVLFWSGFSFYHLCTPTGSPLSIVYRVVKVAMLNRRRDYPPNASGYFKKDSNEVLLLPHNPIFKSSGMCLDKAAIPKTSIPDQEEQQGILCSVEEVNRVKRLLALLPMWTTLLVYALVEATGSTFFIEQSDSLEAIKFLGLTLSINAFPAFKSVVSSLVSCLFRVSIPKKWKENKEKHQLVTLLRIGLGMVCSILCCVTASKVGVRRLNSIHNSNSMSMSWLFPQFTLLGVMEGTVHSGLVEFFNSQVDESMKHCESSLNDCILGIGKFLSVICAFASISWFGDTVNESRLDKYYLVPVVLSCGNLYFYVLVGLAYARKEAPPQDEMDEVDIELVGAEYVTRSTSTNPAITNIMMDDKNLRSRSLEVEGYSSDINNKKLLLRSRTFK